MQKLLTQMYTNDTNTEKKVWFSYKSKPDDLYWYLCFTLVPLPFEFHVHFHQLINIFRVRLLKQADLILKSFHNFLQCSGAVAEFHNIRFFIPIKNHRRWSLHKLWNCHLFIWSLLNSISHECFLFTARHRKVKIFSFNRLTHLQYHESLLKIESKT